MKRSIDQYRNGVPQVIAQGSLAQVIFCLEDQRADILKLHETLVWVRDNYASGSTKEINSRIENVLKVSK
jgi:hypothetical protein